MSVLTYLEPLRVATGPGPVYANSVTITSLLSPADKVLFRAGWFRYVGQQLTIVASGVASRVSGTLAFTVRLGGSNVFAGPALTLANQTNVPWVLRLTGVVRVISSASSLLWQGYFNSSLVVGSPAPSAGGNGLLTLPASAPAAGLTFDRSVDQSFDLLAAWSAAAPLNSIQLHQLSLVSA